MFNFFTVSAQINDWDKVPGCMVDGVPTLKCLEVVFGNLVFMAAIFIVFVLFIMFLVGSFQYLTSFGNPEKVKKAQGTFKFALIGFFLFLGSYLILNIIDILFLGGKGSLFKLNIGGS